MLSHTWNAFAACRCWLLCLLQFFSVIIDCHANKDRDDHLETSKDKVCDLPRYSSLIVLKYHLGIPVRI